MLNVNGTPLSSSEFIQSLYQVAGPRVAEQLIELMSAKEATRLRNVTVGKDEFDFEINTLIKNVIANIVANKGTPPKEPLTRSSRESTQAIHNTGPANRTMPKIKVT